MITTTNNNLCKLMQARHLIVWKYILECSLLSERLFMCYQTWPSPYKFQSKLGLAMNQQKKLRTTMINFLSLSSIKPFPHVSTEFIFSYANLITCHEGHSQPSTVWKKKNQKQTQCLWCMKQVETCTYIQTSAVKLTVPIVMNMPQLSSVIAT